MAYLSLACNLVILFACFTHQFSALPPRMADTTRYILPTWLPRSVFNATQILGYLRFTQLHRPSQSHQPKLSFFTRPTNQCTDSLSPRLRLPSRVHGQNCSKVQSSVHEILHIARSSHPLHRTASTATSKQRRRPRCLSPIAPPMMSSRQRRKSGVRHGRVPRRVPGVVRLQGSTAAT
ncbi:hypothetical protein B0H14DRAFT_2858283 [Mycena olivaceomarginata]|nr:hypothetical protein B0H14DRAFT_2858283 [Mycena olivaceomarginata]